jgi:hypothetical protein
MKTAWLNMIWGNPSGACYTNWRLKHSRDLYIYRARHP